MAQEWEGELLKVPIKKILFYSGMVLLGLVVVFLVCRVLLNLDALGITVRGIFGSLRAIVLGCVMAYLLYPLTRFSEQFLLYHKAVSYTHLDVYKRQVHPLGWYTSPASHLWDVQSGHSEWPGT